MVTEIAQKTGVDFSSLNTDGSSVSRPLKRLRIGMYQRYLGGNMDEGWTRLLLETFEFPYSSFKDKELKAGSLHKKVDVIILPDDTIAVYQIIPSDRNHRIQRVATFVDRDLLQSGWLVGEALIAEKAAMVSVAHGRGKVVLIGFRAQHRMQTHGTFKLVFNALAGGPVNTGNGAMAK